MQENIDLSNQWMVGVIAGDNRIVVANPPSSPLLDPIDALVLAAWLVRVAQPQTNVTFEQLRSAVANS